MASTSARLVGLDVARCLALLGMVAVHVLPDRAPGGDLTTAHWLAGGRAAALFAVLAGVTIALLTGREQPVRGRERLAASVGLTVRALLIALVGLVLGGLGSGLAVILTYYGLLFLLGLPFVGLRARALLLLAAVWTVAAPIGSHLLRPHLPERTFESPSFVELSEPGLMLSELTFTGYYPVVPWLAYLLVGMAVGRLDLARRTVGVGLALGGMALAVVATVVSRALVARDDVRDALVAGQPPGTSADDLLRTAEGGMFGVTPTDGPWQWLLVAAPHSATPFDLAQTIGSSLAVIGLCLLLAGVVRGRGERGLAVLFGAGTMTLSLYSLHVVLRTEPLWPADHGPDAYRWHVLVLLAIGAVFVAAGWRGPLESVVRDLSRAAAALVRSPRRP